MTKKVLNLKPKDMFFYVFSSYLLIGMHISIEHVGGYGLYLPFNIIGWIFISILIGLGFYQVSKTERLIYSNFSIYCLMGSALMFLPLFYSNNVYCGFCSNENARTWWGIIIIPFLSTI